MYPEITSKLRMIDEVLEKEYHIDHRVETVLTRLREGLDFLANKVWDLEHARVAQPPASDPHGHLPGIDD